MRALAWVVVVQVLYCSVLRVVFYLVFRQSGGETTSADLARAFGLGSRFDLRLALLVSLPLTAFIWVGSVRPVWSRPTSLLAQVWLTAAGALGTLIYFFDFGHYAYLHRRLEATVLDELRSPRESLAMIWDTYPVVWGLAALGLITWGWLLLARSTLAIARRPSRLSRSPRVGAAFACGSLVLLGIYGNLSWYPLRWSQAFFSTNDFVSALASNPVIYFAETLLHRNRQADRQSVERNYELLSDLMEVEPRDAQTLSFARRFVPERSPPFRPNLVIVHLESFASFKTGALGNPLPSSPQFDALAKDSLLFTRFFVPTGPTARSVFSMITGIPDVPANNPESSASRDPKSIRQPVLVTALEGYSKHYFLGGSANWANIRALLAGNIVDISIHEEGSFERERVDGWGISDLGLFESAVETFDASPQPFFAFIQTSGNHRPYTIPADSPGFGLADVDEETLRRSGFDSLEAYNGFRLLDYSLGRFFALAAERPWYRDTVFALYGDHGVPAVHDIPFERMGISRHHVPLLIHAPRLVHAGRRIDYPSSSVDILPTCLSLMGIPYVNSALGRDLLADRPKDRRFAFLSNGLVLGEWFLRIEQAGDVRLYRYDAEQAVEDHAAREPALVERLTTMHRAIQDWALWTQHDFRRRLSIQGESL
ncbi:MAG: LTA synthase family protein [Planctomycetota bacterium]